MKISKAKSFGKMPNFINLALKSPNWQPWNDIPNFTPVALIVFELLGIGSWHIWYTAAWRLRIMRRHLWKGIMEILYYIETLIIKLCINIKQWFWFYSNIFMKNLRREPEPWHSICIFQFHSTHIINLFIEKIVCIVLIKK